MRARRAMRAVADAVRAAMPGQVGEAVASRVAEYVPAGRREPCYPWSAAVDLLGEQRVTALIDGAT